MTNKRPWHLWVIALFVLFLYSMGIYDIFMMLSHNPSYYESHQYGEAVIRYFTNYPFYFLVLWICNLLFGFIAPVLLLLGKRQAKHAALVSTVSDFLLLVFTFAFRNRLDVMGKNIAIFDIAILLITIGFYFYCRYIERRGEYIVDRRIRT